MRYWYLIIVLVIGACSNGDITVKPSDYREPAREDLRKAMRYHGILFAKQDYNREWYFIRKGKRCRLFAYLEDPEN